MLDLTKKDYKVFSISALGVAIEFYDFTIFMIFSTYIASNFFSSTTTEVYKLLYVYLTFATGYLMRPIGGIIIGHISDKVGRKKAFFFSTMLMAIATFGIGFTPTSTSIGILAPLLLIIFRIIQGFSVGAELAISTVFLYEHVSPKNQGIGIGIILSGTSLGVLLASIIGYIIFEFFNESQVKSFAWRIPFIIGGSIAFIGFYIRTQLTETPIFKKIAKQGYVKVPLVELLKKHKRTVLYGFILSLYATGIATTLPNFMPAYLKSNFAYASKAIFIGNIICIIISISTKIVFGKLITNLPKRKVLFWLIGINIVILALSYSLLISNNLTMFYLAMVLFGLACGGNIIFPLILLSKYPPNVRVTGYGTCLNFSQILIGFFPAISVGLDIFFNIKFSLFIILIVISLIALVQELIIKNLKRP